MSHIIAPVVSMLRAETMRKTDGQDASASGLPFVTIARQAGAAGRTLAHQVVTQLSGEDEKSRWRPFDRELVEQIADDHHLSRDLIARLEERSHSWMHSIFEAMDSRWPGEAKVLKAVAATVRSLAEMGRVVIVGRGGVFITRDMPQGVHVYLVAPRAHRIANFATEFELSHHEAEELVDELDRNRAAFYERSFLKARLDPEDFDLTINTSEVSIEQAAQMIATLTGAGKKARA